MDVDTGTPVQAAVRARSWDLFRSYYRLEVCAAIESGQRVLVNDLALLLGDPPGKGQVSAELKRLRACGLLTAQRTATSDRTKPMLAAESLLWDAARQIKREVERAEGYRTSVQQ